MTLRPGETPGRAIAVFPFLKTTEPILLGSFTFRSTDDTTDLGEEDAGHVREIADMLFLQNDLHIRSASYAMLPMLDLDKAEPCLRELEHIQAIVAYCYSSPHPTLGTPFFHSEQATLAIFSPEPVTIFLVRPEDHNTDPVGDAVTLTPDEWHRVPGYQGRYNFRQPFWAAKGSRLYPPVPHLGLNISQNLAYDMVRAFTEGPQHHLLPGLLRQPATESSERVLTAIGWYNRANALTVDDDAAILHLAVAFEALLGLPKDAKTDRFVDAVSLLLGRVARLNVWAEQFYSARSDVAHEGTTERLRLVPVKQKNAESPQYQSLLAYGRQIFQLCVGALTFGAYLAERAGLQDKLVTNQERFELICKTLNDGALGAPDRFAAIDDTVALIDEFRFVGETGLLIETMIGAVQAAAKTLLASGTSIEPAQKQGLTDLAGAKRSRDWYDALAAVRALHDLRAIGPVEPRSPEWIMRRLTEVVWHYTFRHYFWLKEERSKGQPQE
jgi:hypothetical protein